MLTERPYQLDACRGVWRELFKRDVPSCLLQAPTGTGKTVIGANLIRRYREFQRQPVLVLAHRREIIDQTARKLRDAGVACGVIMADRPYAPMYDVQVASVDTLDAWVTRGKIELPPAGLLCIDEAHRAMGARYQELIAIYHETFHAKLFGMTATPIRTDGVGLGRSFKAMVCTPGMKWMQGEGYLVPYEYFVGIVPDLKGIKLAANDYNQAELEAVMDQRLLIGDVVDNWERLGRGRPSMFFASGVNHSRHLVEEFCKRGIRAVHVDAHTDGQFRDQLEGKLMSTEIEVVCNAQVYIEGTDIPCLSYIGLARPTKSIGRYLQEVGRGSRPFLEMGKTNCIIADHAGVVNKLGRAEIAREWILTKGKEQEEKQLAERDKAKVEFKCEVCGTLHTGLVCPSCSAQVVFRGKAKNFLPADLVNLSQAEFEAMQSPGAGTTRIERKQFLAELLGYAASKGYARGWAVHKYVDRYKQKPPGEWVQTLLAQQPGKITTKWVLGQNARHHIAKAAREKKSAQQ